MGKTICSNLKYSINQKKTISFEKFIYALGIRHIGLENAKIISKNLKSLKNLEKVLTVKNAEIQKTNGVLNDKTFMFTGKLSNMSRSEAKSLIEHNSGSIVSNVTKKLDYLIVGEKPTNRKVEAAKSLKVKILDQSSWLKMFT